jgi:hypothetical protein
MSDWTDELKEEVIARYTDADPTPETSVEIVKEIAEDIEKTPNGVRMILTKAGVYVSKATAKASTSGGGDKPKRVSKQDAIDALTSIIAENGGEVDEEITSKLTGKAAVYFTEVIKQVLDN